MGAAQGADAAAEAGAAPGEPGAGQGAGAAQGADAAGEPGAAHNVTRATEPGAATNVTRATELASSLEVAASLWAKFMGLMGRPELPAGAGLWLPDSNGIHMMFMRFPIDAVFVGRPDATGLRSVVSVHRSLRAWVGLVPLIRAAHGVLELPVGTIDASSTAVGDQIRIS